MSEREMQIIARKKLWFERAKAVSVFLILVGVVVILDGQVLANKQRIEDNRQALDTLQKSQSQQTNVIVDQTTLIREQTGLILCLLQLQIGGDFSNREECQKRVDSARQSAFIDSYGNFSPSGASADGGNGSTNGTGQGDNSNGQTINGSIDVPNLLNLGVGVGLN